MDPRHQRRIDLLQNLFACTFTPRNLEEGLTTSEGELLDLLKDLDNLDATIQTAAPERPLDQINKIDLAILRLIVFESNRTKTPKPVLIDEGIELAKQFGSDNSSRFINGALAKLLLERAE
jgi:transcription termination factor NusB